MAVKALKTLLDALFITRPVILVPVWGYFLLGYYQASLLVVPSRFSSVPIDFFSWRFISEFHHPACFTALVILTLSVAATYILNQLVDLDTDRANGGLPLLAKADIPLTLARVEFGLLFLIPIVYGAIVGGPLSILLYASSLLNILYNVRPFYFTGRPFLDFLCNAAGFGLVAFGAGYCMAFDNTLPLPWHYLQSALPYFLLMVAGSINSTLPDESGDRATGKVTTVVLLGSFKANLISLAAVLGALISGYLQKDTIAILTSAVSLPFFVKYAVTQNPKHGLFTFQLCGSFLLLLTALVFPWYIAAGLLVYVTTRLYFKFRHGVDYPVAGS